MLTALQRRHLQQKALLVPAPVYITLYVVSILIKLNTIYQSLLKIFCTLTGSQPRHVLQYALSVNTPINTISCFLSILAKSVILRFKYTSCVIIMRNHYHYL